MRSQIADGVDPAAERKARRQREKDALAGLGTLGSVLENYFQHRVELRSAATQRKCLRAVFASYLNRPAIDLTPELAQLAVDDWARTRSKTSARAAVSYAKPFLKWAGKRGFARKGFSDLERPVASEKRQLTLPVGQVSTLLSELSDAPRDNAIRMMLSTGARCGEACGATWREIDLEHGMWIIPGGRRKNVKPDRRQADHTVLLSRRVVAMLRKIGPCDPDTLVFPGPRGALDYWPEWTRRMRRRLGFAVTPHAMRRTFATMLGELGAPPHAVEAALGHVIGGALASAYNKAAYVDEVRKYIGRLGEQLDILEAGSNIMPLPRRA